MTLLPLLQLLLHLMAVLLGEPGSPSSVQGPTYVPEENLCNVGYL